VVALGFKTWIEDRRWARIATEIRALRATQANDGWTWCTSTIARAGPSFDRTTSVNAVEAFEQRYKGGFRVFELKVDTLRRSPEAEALERLAQ
jgi:hypothetical protein